jgi:hypothetical protein
MGKTTKKEKDAVRKLVWKLAETGYLFSAGGRDYSLSK